MFKHYTIKKNQIALVERNGEIDCVLEAGRHYLWDLRNQVKVKVYSLYEAEIEPVMAEYLRQFFPDLVEQHCEQFDLQADEIGVRYLNEQIVEILPAASRHLYWQKRLNQRIVNIVLLDGFCLPEWLVEQLHQAKLSGRKVKGEENLLLAQVPAYYQGVLKVDGQIHTILNAGVTGYWRLKHEVEVEVFSLSDARVPDLLVEQLHHTNAELVAKYCVSMELNEQQVGLRYENSVLMEILAPGTRRLYWRGMSEQQLVIKNLNNNLWVDAAVVEQLIQPKLRNHVVQGACGVLVAQIPAYYVGVLKVDGVIHQLLPAGVSGYWRFNRDVQVDLVDTRIQAVEVAGQEILTRDKVNLRLNLCANWQYCDVLLAHQKLAKPIEHLYRELQFGLREAIGTRTLDELLENKQIIDHVVTEHLDTKLAGYGIQVTSLGVKDIILPGDMKVILAQVVEAEKSAQANVIRRREETAATRSLLNTAKVMENNPVALRLKEMETLERVAEHIDKISVFGGLDQLLNGLIKIG